MEKYALYLVKNIFQIRKHPKNIKLDRNLKNITKKHLIDLKIFDNDKNQISDIKKDKKERDKKVINIPTVDLYSYAFAITRIC